MRLAIALAATVVILALSHAPALAQTLSAVNFGNAVCTGEVPCIPSSGDMPRVAQIAEGCSNVHFSQLGYAFSTDGLDSRRCVHVTPTKPAGAGMIMTPHCCVVDSGLGKACHVECQLLGTRQ